MSKKNKPWNKTSRRQKRFNTDGSSHPRLIHPAVKLALKLSKLPLEKLHRRLAQSARKAACCKHLISELSPGSQFAAGIYAEQTHQLGIFKQVKAEIQSRK